MHVPSWKFKANEFWLPLMALDLRMQTGMQLNLGRTRNKIQDQNTVLEISFCLIIAVKYTNRI